MLHTLVGVVIAIVIGICSMLASTIPGGQQLFYDIFHNKLFHMGRTFEWPPALTAVPAETSGLYGWVLVVAVCTALHCYWTGCTAASVRARYMGNAYIAAELSVERGPHTAVRQVNRVGIVAGCYPDSGSGRFSDALEWEAWLAVNSAQRST